MTRDDLAKFRALEIDFEAIGLLQDEAPSCFCTPAGAEYAGCMECDGVHFVLLPGDERVYCVEPSMGEPGTYVLPVGSDFREFLSFVLYCRDANPLSQIFWMKEEQFRRLLAEDSAASWPGSEAFFQRKDAALAAIKEAFGLTPADPFAPVRQMQSAFDPGSVPYSDEYYDVLGLEPTERRDH